MSNSKRWRDFSQWWNDVRAILDRVQENKYIVKLIDDKLREIRDAKQKQ